MIDGRLNHHKAGPDPGFGFGGDQVERRRRKDRGAESIDYGSGVWEGMPPPQKFFFILGSQKAYFGAFFGPSAA